MYTYQIRPRVFRQTAADRPLVFPAECEVRFHFQPPQPFGSKADGGRTTVQAVGATTLFNANNGEYSIESKKPLAPVEVRIESPDQLIHHLGQTLTITQSFDSLAALSALVDSIYYGLPPILNVGLGDPPYIERVDGKVGGSEFRWELAAWDMNFTVTTQDRQEQTIADAHDRMALLAERRRLFAALHYFHQACRLDRVGSVAGEFLGEVVVNLAKTLEVLFPESAGLQSREAARAGLRSLGISDADVEADFIPAMALRSYIDGAHVQLGLFTMADLRTIHEFTLRAELAFRKMLELVLKKMEAKEIDVDDRPAAPADKEALAVVERIRTAAAARGRTAV